MDPPRHRRRFLADRRLAGAEPPQGRQKEASLDRARKAHPDRRDDLCGGDGICLTFARNIRRGTVGRLENRMFVADICGGS